MARENNGEERKTGVASWNDGTTPRRAKSSSDRTRRIGLLVALLALCVACVVCAWPPNECVTRGLWLKGGTAVTMTASKADGTAPTSDELSSSAATIRKRMDAVGVSESEVSVTGDDTVVIDLPWDVDAEAIAQAVGGTGVLEFVRVDEIGDADALAKINAGTENVKLQDGTYTAFMDGSVVTATDVTEVSSGTYAVTLTFNDEGTQTFADVTRELAESGGRIAIVVDGRVTTAPSVSSEIDGGQVSITGDFTAEEARALKAVLDTGTLPLSLELAGSEEVGPLVGTGGLWALAGVAVAVLLAATVVAFVRYRQLAVVVGGALVVYGVTMLGAVALASRLNLFVLTLPGVVGAALAGVVTGACAWLMVRHYHERVAAGRSAKSAALSAGREALRPVAWPCVAAVVVSLVLLFVPMLALRAFGTTVVFGAICGIVADGWYALTLLRFLAAGAAKVAPAAAGPAGDKTS